MYASAQTIWAPLLLAGCALSCVHMTRPGSPRLLGQDSLVAGGLVGLTCACAAAIYASIAV